MLRSVRIGAIALAVLLPGIAGADDEFYKGRQISWILSADVGGGYASYARAFAPYFSSQDRKSTRLNSSH